MGAASIWQRSEPAVLLVAAGFCIGSIFALSKLAVGQGILPAVYVGGAALGSAAVLGLLSLVAGHSLRLDRETAFYSAVAGQITFSIPWAAVVTVVPHLGVGVPAIVQSLAPIVTLAIVYALSIERPSPVRLAGLLVGLIGTLLILFVRNDTTASPDATFGWYLASLIAPVVLAAGNVFRTTHWPAGRHPLPLATWTMLFAAAGLALALVAWRLFGQPLDVTAGLAAGWHLILLQSLATGIGYGLFFRLQQVGGPLYVSQMSYMNTAVGVAFAVLLFSEKLSVWIWLALALIVVGVAMVNATRGKASR